MTRIKGFTVIEALILAAIIGCLAMIVVGAINDKGNNHNTAAYQSGNLETK